MLVSFGYACVQDCLRKVVKGVGGLDHANWRAFGNSQKVWLQPDIFLDA